MSTTTPKLGLLCRQDVPQGERYFHIRAIPLHETLPHCVECSIHLADVYVSSDEPLRSKEPMCKAHAHLAQATWMVTV